MEGRCFLYLLFLIVPALSQPANSEGMCPEGFECIDGSCYYFSDDKVGIDEAKWECEEYLGGSLATFDDCDTMDTVVSSGEPCPYWIHPATSVDCVEEYPPEYNKYICQVEKVPENEVSNCEKNCNGECLIPDESMDNLGCYGEWKENTEECGCPYEMMCCCREPVITTTEAPTECPTTDPPASTDEHGCGDPEVSTISDDTVFSFEAVYEAMMEYRSNPYASDMQFDAIQEQFEQLGNQDGQTMSEMTGDLADPIKAMKNVWVLQYMDSDTGYEMAIFLEGFDPQTGMLPEDLDFSGLSYSYELKDKLYLLKQRYAALKLTVYIPDYFPSECEYVIELQLNLHFKLLRVPLVLVPCIPIQCQVVIVIPVVCYYVTYVWRDYPYCYWEKTEVVVVKHLIIYLTFWVRSWWKNAFLPGSLTPLPVCPEPGIGDIAPNEEFKPGFVDAAMKDFKSSVPDDVAADLNIDTFGYLYETELEGKGGTSLLSMEGEVSTTTRGFRDMWVLSYRESEDDMETSILLENFDPLADDLPVEMSLGDVSDFSAYNERYIHNFQYNYMEMRQSLSLQSVIPTNCGPALHEIQLNARFTLRRIPFFLMACWEIQFKEYLFIPIPCYEICYICGIRVVMPMIKVLVIQREFWFRLWLFIPAPCPLPPAPKPGAMFAFGNPNGRNHGDTCEYQCQLGFQECLPFYNPLQCLWGQWFFEPWQLECSLMCPPDPPAGFGAFRTFCMPFFGKVKRICFYDCFPGWVPWWGSFIRGCLRGRWTGSPLICLPPWIPRPPWGMLPGPIVRPPRPRPDDPNAPCDCKDILVIDPASPSGIYMVYPKDGGCGFKVYCDMETDGGGWTVIQRRQDGSVEFYLGWSEYKKGFPPNNLTGEFWLGNEKIHRLTTQKDYALRVDLQASDNTTAYAEYDSFSVGDEAGNYTLSIGGYSATSTAGDAMTPPVEGHNLNGRQFSTYDRDNDSWDGNCAERFIGAWWYCACHDSNLNGDYDNDMYGKGVMWKQFKGLHESLPFSELKIRPTA